MVIALEKERSRLAFVAIQRAARGTGDFHVVVNLDAVADHRHIPPHERNVEGRPFAEFETKMAEVLCVYREVAILKSPAASQKPGQAVAVVSYDEKPGIQAIATTAPDLSPEPGVYATFARDHEYKRQGTLSLLAGIDLLTGKVHALAHPGSDRRPLQRECTAM